MEHTSKIKKLLDVKGTEEGFFLYLESLKDPDFRVRKVALEGLLRYYPQERLIDRLIEFLYIEDNAAARNTAIEALIQIGPPALRALESAFETENHDVRKFIVDVAGQMNSPKSVHLLLRAIQDADENVRAAAAEYLGKLKVKEAVGPLIKMLHGEDLWVKYSVIEALGMIATSESLSVILDCLKDRNLSEVALRALGNFGSNVPAEEVLPFLQDRRRSVASQALITLSRIINTEEEFNKIKGLIKNYLTFDRFMEIIIDAVRSDSVEMKKSGIKLLGFCGKAEHIEILLDMALNEELSSFAEEALLKIGKKLPHALESYLWKGFPEKRRVVARVMAMMKTPVYYDSFMKALSEVDGHVVSISARALAEIGDRQSVERLIPLLGHPFPDVQEAAIDALIKLGRFIQTEELRALLHSPSEVVRANATLVTGRLNRQPLVTEIGLLTGDPSVLVRKAAAEALATMSKEETIVYLKRALKDEEPDVKISALSMLSGSTGQALIDEISALLKDPVAGVRVAAIRALSRIKNKEVLALLRQMLFEKDPYIVVHAIEALKNDLGTQTTEAIKSLLCHPDREVKRTALEALALRAEEQTILPYLLSEDWALRLAAVRALSRYPSATSRKALRELYQVEEDPLIREAIQGVLNAAT